VRVIGLMSGTSMDGIDAAGADLEIDGEELVLRPLGGRSRPYPAGLRQAIAAALPPAPVTAEALCILDNRIGQAFAEAAEDARRTLCGGWAELVVSHGQTIFHWVEGRRARGTLQLGQPSWIAERTGLPVIADLRSRDIAAGGQGAPLVSLFDILLLGGESAPGIPGTRPGARAALNLGGIANLTVVPPAPSEPFAFDAGPGNALIDAATGLVTGGEELFDRDGRRGARGRVHEGLLAHLLQDSYYDLPPPKSTGKERFHLPYLLSALEQVPALGGDDVVATVTAHAAGVVAGECVRHQIGELVVSGGGTENPTLMAMLREQTPGLKIRRIEELGLTSSAKEAYAFAVLGYLTFHGLPATAPSCTGADHPSLLGSLTPGREPLRLPPPTEKRPRRLRVVNP
jgi:anhydro-N-acetylmuramic acid kinase